MKQRVQVAGGAANLDALSAMVQGMKTYMNLTAVHLPHHQAVHHRQVQAAAADPEGAAVLPAIKK
jgi:hypothetical protein